MADTIEDFASNFVNGLDDAFKKLPRYLTGCGIMAVMAACGLGYGGYLIGSAFFD